MKVVISRPIPGAAVELLKQAGHTVRVLDAHRSDEEFQAALGEADGVIPLLSDTLDARIIRQSGHLRAIANYAVGFNNIDLVAATGAGIVVTNTPDVLTDATADTALILILMTMRRVRESEKLLRDGLFKGWKPDVQLGLDLAGKNLGILGMGRIGQAVAHRAEAFGMKIVYHTRSGGKASLPYPHVSFETLLAESDVLSLHLPLTDMTRHLIGEAEFKRMKKTAVLSTPPAVRSSTRRRSPRPSTTEPSTQPASTSTSASPKCIPTCLRRRTPFSCPTSARRRSKRDRPWPQRRRAPLSRHSTGSALRSR